MVKNYIDENIVTIGERCDPDEIIDALGLDSATLVVLLSSQIADAIEAGKFDYVLENEEDE